MAQTPAVNAKKPHANCLGVKNFSTDRHGCVKLTNYAACTTKNVTDCMASARAIIQTSKKEAKQKKRIEQQPEGERRTNRRVTRTVGEKFLDLNTYNAGERTNHPTYLTSRPTMLLMRRERGREDKVSCRCAASFACIFYFTSPRCAEVATMPLLRHAAGCSGCGGMDFFTGPPARRGRR